MTGRGAYIARLQRIVRYWGTEYDWRKDEAKLNDLPHHCRDRRARHSLCQRPFEASQCPTANHDAWLAGLRFRQLKTIGPLTDPTALGGSPQDGFELVLPSML
jgi:hypothetical protein